jgi:phosphatidylserine/phosphatidylglycerophosphate/cardiolipin synthase-like enzyme
VHLIVQPDAGVTPVVAAIRHARVSIDIAIFRMDRQEIEQALAGAVARGVRVRALVAHTNRGGEAGLRKLEQRLLGHGVTLSRTADDLARYHAKYMIADGTLHVFGFNFTKVDIEKSRSFGIQTRDRRAVAAAIALFEADALRQPYAATRAPLVVSPESARPSLTAFLKGARRDLAIYDDRLEDAACLRVLRARVAKGVRVRVIGRCTAPADIDARRLAGLRLHVRAIVRDGTQLFVGSQSLRRLELDARREVGLIVGNPAVARRVLQVFDADWEASAPAGEAAAAAAEAPSPAA